MTPNQKEKELERFRVYREQNRERILEVKRKYREQNRKKLRDADQKYREEKRKELAKKSREYHAENRDKVLEQKRKRRANASTLAACSRSLVPHGGDDRVWTPDALATRIVSHYQPTGTILEPCKGQGSFVRALPVCDWCEIDEGRDFLAADGRWDWIVTNPPWSQFRPFLAKSMQVADNVVFLVTMNHFFTKARMRDVAEAGFGFVEALLVETPPEPWPQSGFQVAAVYLRKGYNGPMAFSYENVRPLAPADTQTPDANGNS